ncbi:uncharacterized protein BX663DRAFT_68505 [Cokeromyces recurvatus]|uniref:uncharacterized protein n=1 Tax=Cokeromyces recurvatus TaxID=90255 RepID=UPI00221E7645|nr:uncharacterized protein BX663DRAFT_68505 [Cokeromyces recurvatus]KAI7902753.1 hypothetical protein BX663DRAFT_68505 [Cokeromyces recurvatus]
MVFSNCILYSYYIITCYYTYIICLVLVEYADYPSTIKPFSFMFYFSGRGVILYHVSVIYIT